MTGFDYDLPESLIAQVPLEDRADSRLLHIDLAAQSIWHRRFRDAPDQLREGDLLVVNDTRVTAVRLYGNRPTGGQVEALLLSRLESNHSVALLKPGRRLKPGAVIEFGGGLRAVVVEELDGGRKLVRFDGDDVAGEIASQGVAPLPPYIRVPLANRERYQTVYNRSEGSAAAPTAGLHFTDEILANLRARGCGMASVTLDVGLDTFRPISAPTPEEHAIHGERCRISEAAAEAVNGCRGRVIAVGTTAARTLESFAVGRRRVRTGEMESRLFIRPGYAFQIIDGMFTNFHMPRTTMLLMLGALAGQELIAKAYDEAIQQNYRFLSFGDSMLIL